MSTKRETILIALQCLLASDDFFPPAEIDAPEPQGFREISSGLGDFVSVQDGPPPKVTRDGGAENDYELELETTIAYAVEAGDIGVRRKRCDAAAQHLQALIQANRTLGVSVETYAEIGAPTRDDTAPVPGAAPVSVLLFPVIVTYTAPSPAG